MWLITVLITGILLYILYRTKTGVEKNGKEGSPDVISILNRRLANGEISEEAYDRLKNRITG